MKQLHTSFFLFLVIILIVFSANQLKTNDLTNKCTRFGTAFTVGYIFKNDCRFKEVYGRGMTNAVTADFFYYPWDLWAIGAKLSYWRSKGCTSFLNQRSIVQEIPFTFYLRRLKAFNSGYQLYGSLGGGFIRVKEKSYLGKVNLYKGLGEIEVGLNSPVWNHLNLTLALRYLFPSQCNDGYKANIGGFDLRIGLGISL